MYELKTCYLLIKILSKLYIWDLNIVNQMCEYIKCYYLSLSCHYCKFEIWIKQIKFTSMVLIVLLFINMLSNCHYCIFEIWIQGIKQPSSLCFFVPSIRKFV